LYILCEYGRLHLFFSGCSFFAIIAISTKIGILSGIFNHHHRIGWGGKGGSNVFASLHAHIYPGLFKGRGKREGKGGQEEEFCFFAQRYQKLEFLMTRFLWTCGWGELNSSLEKKGEEVRDTKIKIKIKSYIKTHCLQCRDITNPHSPSRTPQPPGWAVYIPSRYRSQQTG
jgi:hypothetical protein